MKGEAMAGNWRGRMRRLRIRAQTEEASAVGRRVGAKMLELVPSLRSQVRSLNWRLVLARARIANARLLGYLSLERVEHVEEQVVPFEAV